MKLSDIVSHAGLAIYAEVALVLFLLLFLTVMVRLWRPSQREELEAHRLMPFEDGTPVSAREGVER
jgi:cbb3-type cytochrome oxidase subunit 3